MKKLLISTDVPDGIFEKLSAVYNVIKLNKSGILPAPVSSHADMLCGMLDGKLILTRAYYEKNKGIFKDTEVILTDEQHGKEYPGDVLLNFIDIQNAVIGKAGAVSKLVSECGKKFIQVKQGYCRCSTLIAKKCAVSADSGVLSALATEGYDTLKITPGYIDLLGYDCGFIGGASFYDNGVVYFFGSLDSHPDNDKIKEFLSNNGVKTVELSGSPLYDLGGAVVLY